MALERPGSLRSAPHSARRRLTGGRLVTLVLFGVTLLAIVLPAATLVGLELDRRSLVVERAVREAQLELLRDDLEALTTTLPAASPTPSPAP